MSNATWIRIACHYSSGFDPIRNGIFFIYRSSSNQEGSGILTFYPGERDGFLFAERIIEKGALKGYIPN